MILIQNVQAACSGTNILWGGGSAKWNTATNWSPANVPNVASESAIINSGNATPDVALTVGCINLNGGTIIGSDAPAKALTLVGDGLISTVANGLTSNTKLSYTLGPHTTPNTAQSFIFNQSTQTILALNIPNTSIPATGFGVTVQNTNASTATITTLANTGLNTSNYIGNITASTYSNNKANALTISGGTFIVNNGISSSNTVSGGSITILSGGELQTTTFGQVAGSTTTVNSGGQLTATTSSTFAGTLNLNGTMTTPSFTPASGATITINNGGTLSVAGTANPAANITIASGGNVSAGTYSPSGTSTTNINGTLTATTFSPGAGTTINVNSGGVLNVTTFTPNATAVINVASGGTLNITTMTGTLAATVSISGTMTVTNQPTITTGTLDVKSGGVLAFTNGLTISGATVKINANGKLRIASGKTLSLTSGSLQVIGTEDDFPQDPLTKGLIEAPSGTFTFTTTGGTLSLAGFQIARLDVNGLNIGGTTTVTNLRGGQLTNLSTSYSSVKAIQINTTGTIPVSASRVAWNWGNFNVFTGTNPSSAQGYKLVSSTGCANHSIDFTGWTGDWYETQTTFDVTTKISSVSCSISLSGSSSAVSLMTFNAVPFDHAVDVRWSTNAERNHLGFNVYRSDLFSAQFQQVNKSLIRNLKNSSRNQASYRFIDTDVTNGQIYYYYIEDVEVSGKKVLHGPVTAIPSAGLGNAPADNANENSDTNADDNDDGGTSSPSTIPNPSYEDLGNGVVILSKTSSSIRLQITPAAPQFTASAWNNSYQDVSIAGYSKLTTTGSPELPEKDLLIEVQSFAETAQVINQTVTESTLAGHLISPAPNYTLNGSGVLVPSYSPDATRYSTSADYPSAYYNVQSDLVSGSKSKFLKIKIHPLKLNPVTQNISMATKIILDIGLNGDDWDVQPPSSSSNSNLYAVANTLRIDITKAGIYKISYDDLVNSEVDGPFAGKAVSQFRLYNKNDEIPMEIYSPSGIFSSGDYIQFYSAFTTELESYKNQLILSPVNLKNDSSTPLRITSVESDPAGQPVSSETKTTLTKTYEQNLVFVDGITLEDSLDHFFYADLVNYVGMDTLSVTASLLEIDLASADNVQVKFYVRGKLGQLELPVRHDVNFYIGNTLRGHISFDENERSVLTFSVPAAQFAVGNNTLKLKVTGALAPATDYDMVLVDKLEVIYKGSKSALSNTLNVSVTDTLKNHTFSGFTSNQITIYDITNIFDVKNITMSSITTSNGGVSYSATFLADDEVDNDGFKKYSLAASSALLRPVSLSLNPGYERKLSSSYNRADLIVYGDENLLDAARDLIEHRIDQGLDVITVTPAQVYAEFSFGVQKSDALKSFMNDAVSHWEKAPRYLLILGDGTYDPKDFNIAGLADSKRSVVEKYTMPAPIIPGRFIDFSTDNYYVTSNVSHVPKLSVGRLPTNDSAKIKSYVDKVIKYENGDATPISTLKQMSFIADEDTGEYEHFNQHSQTMMTSADGFTSTLFDRTVLGSKAATKAKIISEFSQGPLLISMMGHGAFDRFGDNIFNVTDAGALSNSTLPIVAAWNCETAYFYDADKTYKSLGEELIFNPNGGAIVFIGSTTQTTPPAQAKLAQNFFSQFSSVVKTEWTGTRFGDLLYRAKLGTGEEAYEKDIVNSFSIIGDPSLKLPEQLFPNAPVAKETPAAKKGLFGCTANAGENGAPTPWHEGLLEWIFYMVLIVYGTRKVLRVST